MPFTVPVESGELSALLLDFVALVGETRWWNRAEQLRKDALRSPAQAVIVANSHWLEIALSEQFYSLRSKEKCTLTVSSYTLSALYFAGMVVEVHRRLASEGQIQLFGRLRDSIKTGFAGLYLEMAMARVFLDGGYAIDFPDLEHRASYDMHFWSDDRQSERWFRDQAHFDSANKAATEFPGVGSVSGKANCIRGSCQVVKCRASSTR